MKTINFKEFVSLKPCLLGRTGGVETIQGYFDQFEDKISALDVIGLKDVSVEDKLWVVMHPQLVDESVLHEFACLCAEYALYFIENPDPRSLEAIATKRRWIKGDATRKELLAARREA